MTTISVELSINSLSFVLSCCSWLDRPKTSSCLCVWTATPTEQMTWRWSPTWSRSGSNQKSSSTTTCCVSGVEAHSVLLPLVFPHCGSGLALTGALILTPQGAPECTQGQSGYHGEAGDLQWAVQCQESQQHASPPHGAPAQPGTGSKGATGKQKPCYCCCHRKCMLSF